MSTTNFNYNNWNNTWGYYDNGSTYVLFVLGKGSNTLTSEVYPIYQIKSVSATVVSGYNWTVTYNSDNVEACADFGNHTTVNIYLVRSDNTRVSVASAKANAKIKGLGYADSETKTCSYTISNNDLITYTGVQIEYSLQCVGASYNQGKGGYYDEIAKYAYYTQYETKESKNPTGQTILTLRDYLPVKYNNNQFYFIHYNNSEMSSLKYDGYTVYEQTV